MYCRKCGNKLIEGSKYCSFCGEKVIGTRKSTKKTASEEAKEVIDNILDTEDSTNEFKKDDIEKNKGMAIISYFGFLALVSYFGSKDSKFAQYHAKQGMNLFIFWIIYTVVYSLLSLIKVTKCTYWYCHEVTPLWIVIPCSILGLLFLALAIYGIVNAASGKAKELPIIGKIKIFK